jgi:photosystem II stability/assembly factor-like uncharacterized protein
MPRLIIFLVLNILIVSILVNIQRSTQHEDIYQPIDWFYQQRAYPSGKMNRDAYKKSIQQAKDLRMLKNDKMAQWEFAGPFNIGGRLTDVEINPLIESEIWVGAASGGIFKSSDGGLNFAPVFDNEATLSIGDIAFSSQDANTVYVGTGEANPGGGSLAYDGNGIYSSNDGGLNWQQLGLTESGSIGRIAVHPSNHDIVYVAAMGYLFENNSERGVYKTTNGGASWEQILYLNDSTGAIDIVLHPSNPDTVYAVMWERVRRLEYFTYGGFGSGIYRSYDGGDNWEELTNGLPDGINVGRIGIDISKSNPDILYTIYADRTGYFEGLFKSDDGGDSWIQTNDEVLEDIYSSFGWWFGRLKIDPADPNIVYAIGLDLFKTTDGGETWSDIRGSAHVDQHEVAISASNSGLVYLANDGGFYTSINGGEDWDHNKTLPITQFYTSEIDFTQPYRLYGGTQDNGTVRTLSGNPQAWAMIYFGDGFYCMVDYTNARYVYAEYQYGNFARSTDYGSNFIPATSGISNSDRKNWNTPVIMNPINPNSLYYGSQRVYKSTNKAVNWSVISDDLTNGPGAGNQKYGTITTLSVSPADTNIIYAGTDDANVWVSQNNGENWMKVSDDLPQRWISRVVADPESANVAYVTLSGFRENEYLPHVFKTEDNGWSWEDISDGLPEAPVNDLIVWPDVQKRIIVATDVGVFFKNEGYDGWNVLADGLPLVPVTDLTLHWETGTIAAATYGRSMYTISIPVGQQESSQKNEHVSVYPNPAHSFIKLIAYGNYKIEGLTIFDMQGKIILRTENLIPNQYIDISFIKKGIYLYEIKTQENSFTGKLICH